MTTKKEDIFVTPHPELTDKSVEVYDPEDRMICTADRHPVFLDICLQVMRHYGYDAPLEPSGYYCMLDGTRIDIRKNGSVTEHPEGFFDLETSQLEELCGY